VDGDGIRLIEHNCAVLDVARDIPAACRAELDLFRDVLGVDVIRERHIAAGDRCCEYRVAEPTEGREPGRRGATAAPTAAPTAGSDRRIDRGSRPQD
jgi:hypothetical protein